MIDELLDYIFRSIPEERAALYKDGFKILREIDPQVMDYILTNFAATAENFDTAANINSIHSLLINNVSERIEEFGVYLKDDYDYFNNLTILVRTLEALYLIEHYENMVEFQTILETTTSHSECMAEVIQTINSGVSVEDFQEMVQDVSTGLISRIKAIVADRTMFNFEETHSPDDVIKSRAKAAMALYETTGAARYFTEGGVLGLPVSEYISYFYKELESYPIKNAMGLLLTCGVFAGVEDTALQDVLGEQLPIIYTDANKVILAGRTLRQLPLLGSHA